MTGRPPLGQGTGSILGCGDEDDDGEPRTTVCPQLAGGPHHPGVYVIPAPRSVNPPVRATTFAAAVASGPPMTEGSVRCPCIRALNAMVITLIPLIIGGFLFKSDRLLSLTIFWILHFS